MAEENKTAEENKMAEENKTTEEKKMTEGNKVGGIGMTLIQVFVGVVVAIAAIFLITATFPKEAAIPSSPVTEETTPPVVGETPKSAAAETEEDTPEPVRVEIQTKLGTVQGVEEVIKNSRVIHSFRGIPYAVPPVGELRFKDPVAIGPWSGAKGGKKPPVCPQIELAATLKIEFSMHGEEDCLYLNVFSPKDASDLPVMVFIHGGGFYIGDADVFGGNPKFLLAKDIVLVSIQYRLGALGFLSTEDSVMPGNLGMKDQTLALRWVQDNIRDFGGDPSRVTIFGQSAGGAAVHLHVLSPYSGGLFQRAITQSGTALAPFGIRDNHKQVSNQAAVVLGCSNEGEPLDSAGLLACFQNAKIEDLVELNQKLTKWSLFPYSMVPRVDGDYIPDHPVHLIKEGRFNKVNIMGGITQHENVYFVTEFLKNASIHRDFEENFDLAGPLVCGLDTEESAVEITRRLFYHYVDGIHFSEDYTDEFEHLLSDCFFNMGHDESVLLHTQAASASDTKVYAYEYQYPGKDNFNDLFNFTISEDWVPHGSEIHRLFDGILGLPDTEDPTNIFVSEIMVQLWTDFAITGNPTPDLSLGFKWHPMSEDAYHFLAIKPSPTMKTDYRAQRREFWRTLPTKINKMLYPENFAEEQELSE